MKVAAIVVIYKDTKEILSKIKESLLINEIKEKDIFFSDNTKENLGYGGGINRVLKKILNNYDAFLIINPDIEVHKDCVNQLIDVLERNNNIGIVGPKILDENGKIWSIGGELDKNRYSGGLVGYKDKDKKYKEKILPADFVSGTAMLIRKEVFEKIGFFTEDYFLYYEDVDFCLRAKKSGFNLTICPEAVITHFASSTIGKNSPMQQYYMARNHIWLVERFAPWSVKLHEIFRLPKTLFQAKNNKYELLGIKDYFLRKVGKYDNWS